MSRYVSVKLVCVWGQIIVLNQTIPAEVETKYMKFLPLSEMTNIPAPSTISGVMSRNRQLVIHISVV